MSLFVSVAVFFVGVSVFVLCFVEVTRPDRRLPEVPAPARPSPADAVLKDCYRGPTLQERYVSGEIELDEFEDEVDRLLRGVPSRAQEALDRTRFELVMAERRVWRPVPPDDWARAALKAKFERE